MHVLASGTLPGRRASRRRASCPRVPCRARSARSPQLVFHPFLFLHVRLCGRPVRGDPVGPRQEPRRPRLRHPILLSCGLGAARIRPIPFDPADALIAAKAFLGRARRETPPRRVGATSRRPHGQAAAFVAPRLQAATSSMQTRRAPGPSMPLEADAHQARPPSVSLFSECGSARHAHRIAHSVRKPQGAGRCHKSHGQSRSNMIRLDAPCRQDQQEP